MSIESTQSIRPKPVTARNAVENILRRFVAAVAKVTNYFLRSRHRASDEKHPESVAKEAGAVATTTEAATTTVNATANPTITESFTGPIIADVKVDADAQFDTVPPESVAKETGAIATTEVATTTVNVTANPTITGKFIGSIIADVKVDADAQIDIAASTVLDQEEIQRRRDLVRTLFNDFWTGSHEKPAAFVDRLDQAENYVNERLAASGEFWQLDAKARLMLGLPPRKRNDASPCRS
jgi:hypothetical protein